MEANLKNVLANAVKDHQAQVKHKEKMDDLNNLKT